MSFDILQEDGGKILQEDGGSLVLGEAKVINLSETMAFLDNRSWNDMSLNWDDYTLTWDDYGDMPIIKIKGYHRIFADTITQTDTIQYILTLHRTLLDSITHSEAISKILVAGRTLTDSITHTENFSRVFTVIREVADWLPIIPDTIIKIIKKPEVESLTMTETITRNTTKNLVEALHLTEVFATFALLKRILTDTLTISEYDWTWDKMTLTWDDYTQTWDDYRSSLWIRIITLKTYTDTLNLASSVSNKAIKVLTETLTHTETIKRIVKVVRLDTIAMVEYFSTRANLGWIFEDTLHLTESFSIVFKEYFFRAVARIRSDYFSGKVKQSQMIGKVSDSPAELQGKITSGSLSGKIKNHDIIGKIIKGL